MYTRRNIRWGVIAHFAWWRVLVFTLWSALVTVVFSLMQTRGVNISLPIAPLGTIGVAVAFYVGFKNNQAYDRYWEARKIWGGIVNISRSWGNLVLSFISATHAPLPVERETVTSAQRTLIYRHLAWINSLRYQLRRKTVWGFEPKGSARRYMQSTDDSALRDEITSLLPEDEITVICQSANSATQILRRQGEHLRHVIEDQKLTEEFRFIELMELISEMYALQGKCERIKNTPFARQYAYFSGVFTWIFITLLPFGLVGEIGTRGNTMVWLTVPVSVVISWIFFTMEAVGDSSEDPFENFINDVPMTALCRTIEIDLRQMLGETNIPEPLRPVNDILM